MAVTQVGGGSNIVTGRGSSKTTGTTLPITQSGGAITVAVSDTVFIGFVTDATAGVPSIAVTSGTATLGTVASLASNVESSSVGSVWLLAWPVTGAGTITTLTLTHTSVTARAGQSLIMRGLPAAYNAPSGSLGGVGSAGDLVVASVGNGGVAAGTFSIGVGGQEGPITDSGAGDTQSNMDPPTNTGNFLIDGTTGGGAASNQFMTMAWTLSLSATTAGVGTNQSKVLATARKQGYATAWWEPPPVLLPDVAMAPPIATIPSPYVATRPRTM